jgi:hypothetical protein
MQLPTFWQNAMSCFSFINGLKNFFTHIEEQVSYILGWSHFSIFEET